MSSLALSAKLDRSDGNTSWGFRMYGGKDFGAPLTIQRVNPGSLAQKCGLQEGDLIMKIGDAPTDYMRHKEAQQSILMSGNSLELALQRGSRGSRTQTAAYHAVQAPVQAPAYAPPAPAPAAPSGGGGGGYQQDRPASPSIRVIPNKMAAFARHVNNVSPLSYRRVINDGTGRPFSPRTLQPPSNYILAARLTPDKEIARAPSPIPKAYKDPSPAFNILHSEVAREPSPAHLGRDRCASPSFQRLQQDLERKPTSPKPVGNVRLHVVESSLQRSQSPTITITNHGLPAWAFAPKRENKPASPGLVPKLPREPRAQSPSFWDLDRQVSEKSPRQVRPASPSLRELERASSPCHHIAQHRSASPSMRSRPVDRRAAHLSSPIPFKKEGSPYRHVGAPRVASPRQPSPSCYRDYNRAPQPFSPGSSVPVAVNKQYNTPINMYSMDNVMDSLITQTSAISIGAPGGQKSTDPIPPWQSGGGGSNGPAQPSPRSTAPAPRPAVPGTWQPKIPTGPRVMKSGRAGDARSMPASTSGGRIPVCNGCGTAIRGPFVLALDKTWCPDHFNCGNPQCGIQLVGVGFVEEDGQLFCERDYEQYFAPRCGKCGRAILRECVNALKDTFHPECFTCVTCGTIVGQGAFHLEDGQIYCEKDWQSMFQTKCYGCQFPIEPGDRWVEALNQNWHSECFNCSTCQVNLEGQSFFAKGGKPYCKKHASTKRF